MLCAALGLSWQLLTVHFNYGGNLTALVCHGSHRSRLPLLLVTLRVWLDEYRQGEKVELDVFLSRLFGEVLSQPGFRLHEDFDAVAVVAKLMVMVVPTVSPLTKPVTLLVVKEGSATP